MAKQLLVWVLLAFVVLAVMGCSTANKSTVCEVECAECSDFKYSCRIDVKVEGESD